MPLGMQVHLYLEYWLCMTGIIKKVKSILHQLNALTPEDEEIPELEDSLRQAERAYKKEQDRTYK